MPYLGVLYFYLLNLATLPKVAQANSLEGL